MSDFFLHKIHSQFSSNIISGSNRPYLIAEIGLNHNKNMDLAQKMIQTAAECGANAVKFQSYTTDMFINSQVQGAQGLYSIFKKFELNYVEHGVLKDEAKKAGIDFISTPLTVDWVENLYELKIPFFKIASGDINNYMLLKEVAKKKVPVIVSTGNSSILEIESNASFFRLFGKKDIIFLHCISEYPASPHILNLSTIPYLRNKLDALTGFSDHSRESDAAFAAVILGGVVVEKHFTLDKNLPGPDHSISANPEELREVRRKMDIAYEMRGEPRVDPYSEEKGSNVLGKRSIYNINGKILAMRPRKQGLPKDSDYLDMI
ncbi:MAG: N-acetylneuraminate synthase family protein [Spirochaetia bacterium]|nr:N-acetylneuraminate synthase family protein [Spirochaetia bacterium]